MLFFKLKINPNSFKYFTYYSLRCFGRSPNVNNVQSKFASRQQQNSSRIGPLGWFLLVVPASTFALGTWQVQRKKWKEDLIAKLQSVTNSDPIPLPEDLSEIENLEYRPVHVKGKFLHDKELYLGPRSLILKGDSATKSQLMSSQSKSNQGYLVITPFQLADRDETILVNRGWVPAKSKNPLTRSKGQIEDVTDVIGVVRLHENRPNFTPKNQVDSNQWFFKDLHKMAEVTGASPILLEATNDFNVEGGPIGGQTRVTLRNEHLSYVFTWYCLSGATSYLWYKQFIQRVKR